ncbi:uncharacterized protein LOC121979516 [Zingiber officinale]|uniref:uncharacterized protein LOC121979516 n=1 Tax=Zingiber officinale TaxID=94328 RepID=UPI001C4AEBE9|nr:uncharacterized protein LOC121979516 [Zingiber officinale]
MWPDFESEPRNLRLALATDGINPHNNLSSRYSCWPIMLVNYNLPPNMCMKRKYIMLTMLISGPKQPGNDIDVYLEVLVEDLQRLWEGVDGIYDAYRKQFFTLKAVLLWTINDFPAYGNLSGCTTHGYYACPVCGEDTYARHLENGKKMSFAGHRRFLSRFHPYRRQMKEFNGMEELGEAARPLSGIKLFDKLSDIRCEFGKKISVRGKKKNAKANKLEVTIEEKDLKATNFRKCWKKKSIFFNIPYWKHLHVRHCLDVMHIEKNVFESLINTLMNVKGKTKDNVAARLDMVEMGIRPELTPIVGEKRTYLPFAACSFTKRKKVTSVQVIKGYKSSRRCMKVFKSYIGSRKHPEGCIVQRYLAEEAIEFCSEYLNDVDPIGVPQSIRDPKANGSGLQACNTPIIVQQVDLQQAHLTVLENMEEVSPYIIEHKIFLKSMFPKKEKDERWIQDAHNKRFIDWFRAKVAAEIDSCNGGTTSSLTWLAHGPRAQIIKYNSYVINGNLYQTKARDDDRVCQNSGVSLVANTMLVCSAKDKNPLLADVSFYGVIEEIWELDYHQFHVPLFKCAWVANDKGIINNDECGFTLVNLNKRGHKNDEFLLASQVNQVFYIDDPLTKGWSIVLPVPNRCYEGDADDDGSSIPDSRPIDDVDTHCIPSHERYFRLEIEGVWVTKKKK